jgi:taurine dioxygenase
MADTLLTHPATDLPYAVGPLQEGLAFGAIVEGLARTDLNSPEVRRALFDLWIEKGVILFRAEDTEDMQVALSTCFGTLERHMFEESWVAGRPELVNVKYYPEDGTLYDIDGKLVGGWLPWHSDLVYRDRINRGGILCPRQLPRKGSGMTGFIDQIAAYEALPEGLKQRIEGLHVVYAMDLNAEHARFGIRERRRLVRFARSGAKIMEREYQYPRVLHPMVYRQKETGRVVLNVSPWFAVGIYEMGGPEGESLLRDVVDHCIDDRNAYFHEWRAGDMVLWDNWRTLHCATGVAADDIRVMHRTTISGDYALGRKLDASNELKPVDV